MVSERDEEGLLRRECTRALIFMKKGVATLQPAARKGRFLLENADQGTMSVRTGTLRMLHRAGLVVCEKGRLELTPEGEARNRRDAASREPFRAQHWHLDHRRVAIGGGSEAVEANLAESPLGPLMRLKARNGKAFLSEAEFNAGERLRADYSRAQIMPRLGANWGPKVTSGRRAAFRSGGVELTDSVLAARARVDRAIEAVGPELAGVLIDVCCFLKGFGQVELERGWPARSAKVVLKTALGALDRHYSPLPSRRNKAILHWGAEGYRPRIGA